jgi:two-component system, cell cycle sensor histidine kinase and response regulator CckA
VTERHRLLERQLRATFPNGPCSAEAAAFIDVVNSAYHQFDADRGLIERALELSSQELLQANSDMRAVVQAFPDLFLWLTNDGTITACRGQAAHDLLLPAEELVGKRLQRVPAREAAARLGAAIAAIHGGVKLVTVEYDLAFGAETRHFEARLMPILENQILAILRNVTERKAAELARARSVSMLQATLESTADGILVVDLDETIVGYNRKFIDLWRIPADVIATRNDWDAIRYALDQVVDPDAFQAKIRELYGDPEATSFDEVRLQDGRILERYSMPQKVDGVPVGRVWSFRDVSDRRRAQEALHRSEERLRQAQKMEAVGRLAGGVAHDFNNVLTAILGFGELSLAQTDRNDPLRSKLLQITAAAARGAELTRQLLTFGRQQVMATRPTDLGAVVANMLPMLQRLIGEHIEVTHVSGEGLAHVLADPVQIEQVVLNLAINARDAMPHGGTLVLDTSNVFEAEGDARPSTVPAGAHVVLTVSDSGTGMSEEVRKRAFEPFFTTKEVGKGTGLGLSTVYGIVTQSGGIVEIDSAPDRGTVVRVYLPAIADAAPRPHARVESAAPAARAETVLVVEDDEAVRHLAREVLRGAGYQVVEARHGAEALELAAARDGFDLVLTDVVMPQVGGLALAKRLLERRPDTRVLLMSGHIDDAAIRNGVVSEDLPFLQKPFRPATLLETVRRVIDDARES